MMTLHSQCVRRRNAHKIFVEKPEENVSLRRPKRRWMDLREVWWERVNWKHVAQPVMGPCEHGNVHPGSIKGGKFVD
jgi:hypothetical protein